MGWFKNLLGPKKDSPYTDITEDYQEHKVKKDAPAVVEATKPSIKPLDLMKVHYVKSPNQSARKGDVKYLVLHHTGPGSYSGIVKWLCNPAAKASAHYVLGRAGQLSQLVNTTREAWHAGRAWWEGGRIDNHKSIGIEICNHGYMTKEGDKYYYEQGRQPKEYKYKEGEEPVTGQIVYPSGQALVGYYAPYPEKQITKLVALCKALVEKYPAITRENVITHYDIGYPEGRKNDPFGLDVEYIKDLIFS